MPRSPLVERVKRALPEPILKLVRAGRWLVRLTPDRAFRLALAQRELLRARRMCRNRPVGSLVKVGGAVTPAEDSPNLAEARGWAHAVDWVSRYGVFRPSCLIRSLAVVALLERAGIRGASIRAGVRRENNRFLAHAWVELGEAVLTDQRRYVAQFEPWADLRIFEEAR